VPSLIEVIVNAVSMRVKGEKKFSTTLLSMTFHNKLRLYIDKDTFFPLKSFLLRLLFPFKTTYCSLSSLSTVPLKPLYSSRTTVPVGIWYTKSQSTTTLTRSSPVCGSLLCLLCCLYFSIKGESAISLCTYGIGVIAPLRLACFACSLIKEWIY
jgi:hypothetical protein